MVISGWLVSLATTIPAQAFLETPLIPPWFPRPTEVVSPIYRVLFMEGSDAQPWLPIRIT